MLYEFRCPECEKEKEIQLPIAERNDSQYCICGAQLDRVMSLPAPAVVRVNGRGQVIDTLNGDNGRGFPGGNKHRKRYEKALASGLDQKGQPGRFRSGVPVTSREG